MRRHDRDQIREAICAENGEILEFVDRLAGEIETFADAVPLDLNDDISVIRRILLERVVSALDAVVVLAERGFESEALGQKRSVIEAMIRLSALSKRPDLIGEYVMQHPLNQQKILGDIVSMRATWDEATPRFPSDDELSARIAEVHDQIDRYNLTAPRKLRLIDSFKWSDHGEVTHLVYGHFPVTSQALHHAPGDLDRYLQVEDGELVAVRAQIEMGGIESMLLDSAKFAFVAVERFGQSQGVEMPESINELYRRHCAMCEAIADRVFGSGSSAPD